MIKYKNISFVFSGKTILEDFNCEIKEGEHCAIVGESGSGKSTLLKSIMGLALPDHGTIYVDGKEITPATIQSIRNITAWVPQEVQLPYETVRETVLTPFSLKINHCLEFEEPKFISLLNQLGLDGKLILEKGMREISGGEKQRVMIALAVLLNKKILLLDEPTSAVDVFTKEKIIQFLKAIRATVIMVTHDDKLASSCDHIVRLIKNEKGISVMSK